MPSAGLLLKRARLENQVLADMAALAQTSADGSDVVPFLLDLIEQMVSSPLLTVTIGDDGGLRHHTRVGADAEPEWAESAAAAVEALLHESFPRFLRFTPVQVEVGPVYCVLFAAETLAGRGCVLTLGSDSPLSLEREEEQLMLRVARQVVLVVEHALLQRRIESLETTDPLTGLPNYRRLLDILQYEIQRHRHSGGRLSVLALDVVGLRAINRTHGNSYGDHILIKLGHLIRSAVRPIDMVARSGLDDFAVVLPETGEDEARRIGDALRAQVEDVRFAGGAITLSVGVAQVKGDEHLSPEEALARAETALHEAKQQDRGWRALSHRQLVARPRL